MRRTLMTIAIAVVVVAGACSNKKDDAAPGATPAANEATPGAAPAAKPAPSQPTSLASFLPASINGTKLEQMPAGMGLAPPDAAGAYLSRTDGVAININLMVVKDLSFAKAQLGGLAPGETRDNHKGFEVQGFRAERTQYLGGSEKSEANLLLADKVTVVLSVEPAKDPDLAIKLLDELDLKAIEAYAKTL